MTIATSFAVAIVALLHIGFMLLEMFLWTKPLGRKVFGLKQEYANQTAILAANQGLYNGFLAAGLTWGLLAADYNFQITTFFLCCVIAAGAYGALSVNKMIFWVQALPAIIALALLFAAKA